MALQIFGGGIAALPCLRQLRVKRKGSLQILVNRSLDLLAMNPDQLLIGGFKLVEQSFPVIA